MIRHSPVRLLLLLCLSLALPSRLMAYGDEERALSYVKDHRWTEAELALFKLRDPDVRDVVQFYLLRDSPQLGGFGDYAGFLRRHPDWPSTDKLTQRAEIALLTEGAAPAQLLDWFTAHPPQTARGEFYLAELRGKLTPQAVREAWRNADFTEVEEARVATMYRSALKPGDDYLRVDRLLWEGRIETAKRLAPRLPEGQQLLVKARIALMIKAKNADGQVNHVPPNLRNDAGLMFERIRFRQDKGMTEDVPELLLRAPKNPPYPSKWWPYRKYAIRDALDQNKIAAAAALAADHGQADKVERSEALFLSGWIDLAFRNQPGRALADFTTLFDVVEFPISKSRAAYWASLAAQSAGKPQEANRWMQTAAKYPVFFYGQLAQQQLYGSQPLKLPPSLSFSEAEWQAMSRKSRIAQVCLSLARYGYSDLALPFVVSLAQSARTPQQAGLAVSIGQHMGRIDFSVRAAKEALNHGFYFQGQLFPRVAIRSPLASERAFAFAIARQESMFYPLARSPANAVGMMQLLPSTARLVAKKSGLGYDEGRLTEPDYNFNVGSLYLDELLERFGHQKALAVAGYNAGPGRPRDWQLRYGMLGPNERQSVSWIERIPFSETRNYVQRVLENYQVYRSLESSGKATLTAREAITQ